MDASPSWETMYSDEKYSWFWPPPYDPNASPPELGAVISLLGTRPGARLLDLACGQGWLTIPLAQRGLQVTGFDLSVALLTCARQAAEQAGVRIEWVRGDMRDLPAQWDDYFEFVSLTLSEFGCFSDETDNQRVLDEVARVLTPGGRFLLDIVVNRDGIDFTVKAGELQPGRGAAFTEYTTTPTARKMKSSMCSRANLPFAVAARRLRTVGTSEHHPSSC